jgi:hypothetical protein
MGWSYFTKTIYEKGTLKAIEHNEYEMLQALFD